MTAPCRHNWSTFACSRKAHTEDSQKIQDWLHPGCETCKFDYIVVVEYFWNLLYDVIMSNTGFHIFPFHCTKSQQDKFSRFYFMSESSLFLLTMYVVKIMNCEKKNLLTLYYLSLQWESKMWNLVICMRSIPLQLCNCAFIDFAKDYFNLQAWHAHGKQKTHSLLSPLGLSWGLSCVK